MTADRLLPIVLTAAFLLFACSSPASRDSSPAEEGERLPDQILEGFTMTITDEGVKTSRFDARRARIYSDEERVESDTVRVEFYRFGGEHYSTLWADQGTLNTDTKDMEARGHVVVVSEDSSRLETESLRWRQEDNRITTDDPVTVTQSGRVIHGVGLESDPSLTDVKIGRPTGEFRDADVPAGE